MPAKRVYLAGPEVFLPNPLEIGAAKRAICAKHGLEGVFPLDNEIDLTGLSPQEAGLKIYRANRTCMDGCDLVIANMTPFRGPSMDVGTAFEMGYMRGLGRPVFGYSNVETRFFERTAAFYGGRLEPREGDGSPSDPLGHQVEQFGLVDNLMLDGAVDDAGVAVITRTVPEEARYTNLSAFEACVELAARNLD